MTGMNRSSGKRMSDTAHIQQSISDILTTPIGSRVMRRDFGSRLIELIDAPLSATTQQQLIAATAEALTRWEPRIQVQKVTVSVGDNGQVTLMISGQTTTGTRIEHQQTFGGEHG